MTAKLIMKVNDVTSKADGSQTIQLGQQLDLDGGKATAYVNYGAAILNLPKDHPLNGQLKPGDTFPVG